MHGPHHVYLLADCFIACHRFLLCTGSRHHLMAPPGDVKRFDWSNPALDRETHTGKQIPTCGPSRIENDSADAIVHGIPLARPR